MKNPILYILLFLFVSCSTKKDILYIQDFDKINQMQFNYSEYTIQTDDILKIDIFTQSTELNLLYNKNVNVSTSRESSELDGYKVSPTGTVVFPSLGKIVVVDKTTDEVADFIKSELIRNGILTEPTVDVKLINANFTILGEVNSPGRYVYNDNNMNILKAIGIAGGLTITASRKDVKILRTDNNNYKTYNIDLRSPDFVLSENFQILSGDIMIVNPNKTRVKNAGIIGNSGTLLSLLSFILSAIIITTR